MPLHIIRQDITKVECDAIVNAANGDLLGGGGVDGAIHRAAGPQLLEECRLLDGCATGEAKITYGYNLPCKYVIHTVGPIWNGGKYNEQQLLTNCYRNSLELAAAFDCKTVAFPLISAGFYKYPKDQALSVAIETISKFLLENDMTVYFVIVDKMNYQINEFLYDDIVAYIEKNYVEADKTTDNATPSLAVPFVTTIAQWQDRKGVDAVACYRRANVSKETWEKIVSEENYQPSKTIVLAFAIALGLSLEETNCFLANCGYSFSKKDKVDVIVEFFLNNGVYNVFSINKALFKFDQPCLGE
jgi:O-acetyl-ADP-ribose deacetylase (regulator of RNase III)